MAYNDSGFIIWKIFQVPTVLKYRVSGEAFSFSFSVASVTSVVENPSGGLRQPFLGAFAALRETAFWWAEPTLRQSNNVTVHVVWD